MEELDNKRKMMLEAMQNVKDRKQDEKQQAFAKRGQIDLEKSKNLSKGTLDKPIHTVKGSAGPEIHTPQNQVVKGAAPVIERPVAQKMTSGNDFAKMQKDLDLKQKLKSSFKAASKAGDEEMMDKLRQIAMKLKKGASRGLKMLPIVGAAAGLLGADDASAAVPILDMAESTGPQAGSLQSKLENGTITPEERQQLQIQALESMKKQ